jgi:hypothetical protein
MANLRAQKKKQYDEVLHRIRRRWKDLKMCVDASLTDQDLIEPTARSAEVSESMASKVLYRKRRSRRVLKYLSAGVDHFQQKHDIPDCLV